MLLRALVVVVLLAGAASARAQQQPSANELQLAREEFARGMESARAGSWSEARDSFARAYDLSHRPRILANLAAAETELGHLVEAADAYRRLQREEPGTASEREAIDRAIAAVEARMPRLTIHVERMETGDEVSIDGGVISAAVVGRPLPVNPGERRVDVRRRNRVVAHGTITLAERERRELTVTVDPAAAINVMPDVTPIDSTQPTRVTPDPDPDRDPLGGTDHRDRGEEEGGSVFASPWLWLAVALVAAGATIGIVLATSGDSEDPFDGNLGPGSWTIR